MIEMIMAKVQETFVYVSLKLWTLIEAAWKVLVLVLMLFEEVRVLMLAVMVLVLLDQFTGTFKALYFRKFRWRLFNRFYVKVVLYITVLIATYIFEEFIIEISMHYFTKGIATVIGFQELASTYLNVTTITGKKYLLEFLDSVKKKLNI